jgi:peptidoglycan/LPS O-acetylase OafA/YrhL
LVNSIKYFPSLNGLRFLAAFGVLIHHIYTQLSIHIPFGNYIIDFFLARLGGKCVSLFFVLSGFLITYLLLKEKHESGKVKVTNFYLRRILRIWPLYFLVIIVSFFVLPDFVLIEGYKAAMEPHFVSMLILYLLFLPQAVLFFYQEIVGCSQTWSIGVEEQFYLIWPLFLRKISKNGIFVFIGILVLKVVLLNYMSFLLEFYQEFASTNVYRYYKSFYIILFTFEIDSLVMGAIAAYLYFYNKAFILRITYHKITQVLNLVLLLGLFLTDITFPLYQLVQAISFSILILNLSTNKETLFSLENPPLKYLGNLSYGIYMYHNIVITMVLFSLKKMLLQPDTLAHSLVFAILTIIMSIGISWLSYLYFEKYFLVLKEKFSSSKVKAATNNQPAVNI